MKQHYCLGFAFDRNMNVVLIKKKRPEWQKNKLNGVGGKIEPYEMGVQAMIREFREETGMVTCVPDWNSFANLGDEKTYSISCYYAVFESLNVSSITDEPILVLSMNSLRRTYSSQWYMDAEVPWLLEKAVRNIHNKENKVYSESLIVKKTIVKKEDTEKISLRSW